MKKYKLNSFYWIMVILDCRTGTVKSYSYQYVFKILIRKNPT